jgi:hypothetical protein
MQRFAQCRVAFALRAKSQSLPAVISIQETR